MEWNSELEGSQFINGKSQLILFAGYSRRGYVEAIRRGFSREGFQIGCFCDRPANTVYERDFVSKLDFVIDVSTGFQTLEEIAGNSKVLITNTRERESNLYIEGLFACGLINAEQREAYHAVNDKSRLKEILQQSFPSLTPKSWNAGEMQELSFPLIAKPTGLCGSLFTKVIYDPQELKSFVSQYSGIVEAVGRREFGRDVSIMLEEFVAGKQYSVNCYINSEGEPTLCPIVRVIPAFEVGIDDTYCAFQYTGCQLSKREMSDLSNVLGKITGLFEIKSTSAHFDIVNSNEGWKLLDMGLRVGSLRQDLFHYSHSMNHMGNDIMNRSGSIPVIPDRKGFACLVSKAPDREGILKEMQIPRFEFKNSFVVSRDYDIKTEEIGKRVAPVCLGGKKLTKHIVAGDDIDEVLEDSRKVFDSISFVVD